MSASLQNAMRAQAEAMLSTLEHPRFGAISSYNPNTMRVKVMLQPEDVESAWMPYMSAWVGAGWGLHAAPVVGAMTLVLFVGASSDSPVALGQFFSDTQTPQAAPSGELWLVHQAGAFIKLTNDGKLTLNDKAGSTVVMNGDGTGAMSFAGGLTINANTTVNGTLTASGNITGEQNITATGNVADQGGAKTMAGMRSVYDSHTHAVPNVQGGTSTVTSNTPNQAE